jgi:D-alanyl-lipoteichoic acid acyltransferase DltB (MBOAT superfamily)
MLFNSFEFIFLFLPITLVIFFQVGRSGYYKFAIAWLVAASLFFYGWWNQSYLVLLIFSILFNYCVGLGLSQRVPGNLRKKLLLAFGITVNLGLISYFKYAIFFLSTIHDFTGIAFSLNKIRLPLGISFFTFEQITFLVDVYRGITKESSLLNYSIFVTFFPRLIAGPIILHRETVPQFENSSIYRFNPEDIAVGLTIFSIGIFKKVVFADNIAVFASPVFNSAAEGVLPTFFEAWGGALAYTLQLYFDFSGYSDMAIGAARMFGIKLPINFNSPYKAVNIINFWRQWHITLSNFLRDYLYIPLGGNRNGELRRSINLMITMLLGGLWHGAGWTFVLWGGLHGAYLIINHQWRLFRKVLGHDLKKSHWWSRGLACFITFLAVVVGWVLFRAENIDVAIAMLQGMVGKNGISIPLSIVDRLGPMKSSLASGGVTFSDTAKVTGAGTRMILTYVWSFTLLAIVWFTPNTQQWMERYKPALEQYLAKPNPSLGKSLWQKLQWQPTRVFGLILAVLIFIAIKIILSAPQSEFLYFNF